MKRFEGQVRQWLTAWNTPTNRERCSVSEQWLTSMPLAVGDNIRLRSEETGIDAAYIIHRTHTDDGASQVVRMSAGARDKLYPDTTTPSTCPCTFVPMVPNIESRSQSEAQSRQEMWEESQIHPSHEFFVAAPHTGDLEKPTGDQARECHKHLPNSSLWCCHAYDNHTYPIDFNRWHITSAALSPNSFPALSRAYASTYRAAVSWHGFGNDEVLIGGLAPMEVREKVAASLDALGAVPARAASDEPYDGDNPDNFVNKITRSGIDGIQIEQSMTFRNNHALEAARVVAQDIVEYYR